MANNRLGVLVAAAVGVTMLAGTCEVALVAPRIDSAVRADEAREAVSDRAFRAEIDRDVRVSDAELLVAGMMRDPGSTRFSDVSLRHGVWVCGYVNSRNGFGGYVGFREFVFDTTDHVLMMNGVNDRAMHIAWKQECMG